MGKIVTISMVRNEADIIESFVRHTLTFADEMIICDHMSSDNTLKILHLLEREGLPITIRHSYKAERIQAEVTNNLLREAIVEHGADYVVPLDADEFLVNITDDEPVRDIIRGLDPMGFYLVRWMIFRPKFPDIDQDQYLLTRPVLKAINYLWGNKSLVGAAGWKRHPYELVEGAHWAERELACGSHNKTFKVKDAGFAGKLTLAHYIWRSEDQYRSKIAVGWLSLVADHGRDSFFGAKYKELFDKITEGKTISAQDEPMEEWRWTGNVYNQPLRYGEQAQINVLANVMRAAESLAVRYAEDQVRALGKKVSVVILPTSLPAETDRLIQETVAGIAEAAEECEIAEIVLPDKAEKAGGMTETAFLETARRYNLKNIKSVKFFDEADFMNELESVVTGDYIQFLEIGVRIARDKLIRQVATFEKMKICAAVIAAGADDEARSMNVYLDICSEGLTEPLTLLSLNDETLGICLAKGRPFYGGISAALFRRENMENVGWFADSMYGGRFWQLSALRTFFQNVWDRNLIGVSPAVGVRVSGSAKDEITGLIWWQIERCLVLAEDSRITDNISAGGREINRDDIDRLIRDQLAGLARLAELNGVEKTLIDEMKSIGEL